MILSDRRKRVTIKDVAQAAGVSTQTVSRVINKFSYVSGETRQRVEAVVDQLGYHPSTLARSLSQQRSYTLGIVTYDLKYIGPSRTLNGIADKADELGYMLLMKNLITLTQAGSMKLSIHCSHVKWMVYYGQYLK
ncbi:MAG: LacI family DNA-binding transcriptional regulator [Anaerolineales bacterium]|nr:LacI family DNA-binding transcriptional regulator [Anaerolineales bacterium]